MLAAKSGTTNNTPVGLLINLAARLGLLVLTGRSGRSRHRGHPVGQQDRCCRERRCSPTSSERVIPALRVAIRMNNERTYVASASMTSYAAFVLGGGCGGRTRSIGAGAG